MFKVYIHCLFRDKMHQEICKKLLPVMAVVFVCGLLSFVIYPDYVARKTYIDERSFLPAIGFSTVFYC